jgi:uncharacterized protein YjbI with pentapeptide repeats
VNLDNSDFHGQNLKGVAFQQSEILVAIFYTYLCSRLSSLPFCPLLTYEGIVRDSDFSGCNLVGARFFDTTLDGSNFEVHSLSHSVL